MVIDMLKSFVRCTVAGISTSLVLLAMASAQANPIVTAGGSSTTMASTPASANNLGTLSWEITNSGGVDVGDSATTNGWSASYSAGSGQISVSAPVNTTNTTAGTGYKVVWNDNSTTPPSATFDVDPMLTGFTLSPTTVIGSQSNGTVSTGTVTLNEAAGNVGITVSLSSDQTVVNMPASVSVASGASSNTFSVTSSTVASQTIANLKATLDSTNITQQLTINPWLASETVSSSNGVGGIQNPTVTVTLNNPAPASGLTVTITSSNTSALASGTITVASGQTSGSVALTSTTVANATPVTITAQFEQVTLTQSYTVNPLIASVALNPSSLVGGSGNTSVATVTLNTGAPAGTSMTVSSSDTSTATVTSPLSFTAGQTSKTFTISTLAVTVPKAPTISVAYTANGVTQTVTQTLYVNPMFASLTLSPSTMPWVSNSTGTVTLNAPAPTGGTTVTLTSSNTNVTSMPASVTVPAGSTSQTFTIGAYEVNSNTNVNITASYAGATKTATLTVTLLTMTVRLSPSSVVGGTSSSGTVSLNGTTATNISLQMSSNVSQATLSPTTLTIPAGASSANFTVNTTSVTSNTTATITAMWIYGDGETNTATGSLTILPMQASVLSLSPTSVVGGYGNTSTGTVTLTGPAPSGGATVTLTSGNTAIATVPASVTVPAGQTTAQFAIATNTVTANTNVTITAANGGATKQATLTLKPLLGSLSLSPSSVFGGASSNGTITLNQPAPSNVTVTLTNSNTSIATLSTTSVSIAAGSTTGSFNISTVTVTSVQTANLTASYGGTTLTQTLTVTPMLSSLSISPTTQVAGQDATGTITLYGPAPAGGVPITLSSNASSVAWPDSTTVTVPQNSTSYNFPVHTGLVTASGSATITAADGTVSRTASITVDPLLSSMPLNGGTSAVDVVGGDTVPNCSVVFNLATPTAVTIPVVSSNVAVSLPTPSNISVASGATSAAFTVPTYSVSSITTTTISSTYNNVTVTGTVRVHPMPTVASVTLNPSTVIGGNNVNATVTLTDIAPAAGATITLTSGNTAVATVPSTVTIASGGTSATFTITTYPTAATATSVITASFNNSSANATLTVSRPSLTGFTISPNSLTGGTGTTGTLTLNGKAPSVGVTINVSCSPAAGASFASSVTVPSGSTSTTFPIATSTVTQPTTLTFTATNSVASSETFNATVSLGLTIVRAVDVVMPKAIVLNWSTPSIGNYLLYRNGVQIASLANTTTSYTDTFAWTSGQVYQFDLYDASNNTLLGTEQCEPYQIAASQDQAVDSRLDPRYTTATYLNHKFGGTFYNGGLFVGYASDPSKVGRSFALFQPSAGGYPSDAIYRAGRLEAYLVQGDIHGSGSITETVGAQSISNTTWDAPSLTWSTAPSVTPSAAPYTVSITYNPASNPTVTSAWYSWPMANEIYNSLTSTTPLSVAWASMNESAQGWVYFAKTEFNAAYGPSIVHIWSIPALVGLTVPGTAHYNNGAGSATGVLTVNAIGLQGSATVSLSSSNTAVATVPSTFTVTGLTRTFPITLVGTGTTTITAIYNGITKTATMTVVNP